MAHLPDFTRIKNLSKQEMEGTSMICDLCSSILQNRVGLLKEEPKYLLFSHHATASSLQSSLSQGCYICTAFCNELFDSDQGVSRSQNLTHLVTRCQLTPRGTVFGIAAPRTYNLMIMLAEDTNLPNVAMLKDRGTIFVVQPSAGIFLSTQKHLLRS